MQTLERRHRAAIKTPHGPSDIRRVERIGLRPDYIVGIERQWRSISALGCVGIQIKRPDKYSITITECRIAGGRALSCSTWTDPDTPEAAISLIANVLTVTATPPAAGDGDGGRPAASEPSQKSESRAH